MVYSIQISSLADAKFKKLAKKNKKQLEIIAKKIEQILENPGHFKPLRGDMHGARRAHIDKSFVLVYEIDKPQKVVRVLDYEHHDNVYG
jgi:mRNA interferase RelE/StbE/toxin YoeB